MMHNPSVVFIKFDFMQLEKLLPNPFIIIIFYIFCFPIQIAKNSQKRGRLQITNWQANIYMCRNIETVSGTPAKLVTVNICPLTGLQSPVTPCIKQAGNFEANIFAYICPFEWQLSSGTKLILVKCQNINFPYSSVCTL